MENRKSKRICAYVVCLIMVLSIFSILPQASFAATNNQQCTVTFSGTGGSVSTSSKTVTYGKTYGSLPTATRYGYVFKGWYTSSGKRVYASTKVTTSTKHTLYAHWEAKVHRVTFSTLGKSSNPPSKAVAYASKYGALPTITSHGYTFLGWYTTLYGGTKVTSSTKVTKANAETLYAHWKARTYLVTFNANGGYTPTKSKYVQYGGAYGTLPCPSRAGYTFKGWYTSTTGGRQVFNLTVYRSVTGTDYSTYGQIQASTLYAHWVKK